MKPLKVLIIEDNEADATLLQRQLVNHHYQVCGIAGNLEQAVRIASECEPDISIIDIYLRGKTDGISFAEKMNAREIRPHPFIFLTNAADKTTFDLARKTGPFSYLLKPFNELEMQYAIELAVEKFTKEEDGYFISTPEPVSLMSDDIFFVKKGNMLAKVLVNDIHYIEVDGRYCKLIYGSDKFLIQKSLKQLQEQLPSRQFLRIHRNYIVNLKELSRINLEDQEIVLQNGHTLAFSRRYLVELMHLYNVLK